jgi:hypothetical protein
MRLSSGYFEIGLEGGSSLHDCPEDVEATTGKGDDGLVVMFAIAPFTGIEGAAVCLAERAECGLIEHALETLVATCRASEQAGLTGLADDGRDTGCGGECVGGAEAREIACFGDEFCGEHGPHSGQATDEGSVRVALEKGLQFAVELDQPRFGGERFDSQFSDQTSARALSRDTDRLLRGGGKRDIGPRL